MSKIMVELIKDGKTLYVPIRKGEANIPSMTKRFKKEGYTSIIYYSSIHTGTSRSIKLVPYYKDGIRKSISPDNVGQKPKVLL